MVFACADAHSRRKLINFHIYFPAIISKLWKKSSATFSRCAIVNNDRSHPSESFGSRFLVSLKVNIRGWLLMPFMNFPYAGLFQSVHHVSHNFFFLQEGNEIFTDYFGA